MSMGNIDKVIEFYKELRNEDSYPSGLEKTRKKDRHRFSKYMVKYQEKYVKKMTKERTRDAVSRNDKI